MLLILTVLTLVVTCTAGKTRTWLSNTNFDNPANWEGNKLPCSTSNVIFPLKHKMPVQLGKELQIHSLFLSDNGALLLPKNGKITFTSETKDSSCGGGDIRFTRRKQRYWIDPENWSGSNAATPHLERVPCFDDELIFPENHSFYVGLPRFFSNAASVTIDGQKLVGWNWKKFLNDKIGRRTFQPHLAPLAVYNYPCPQNDDCDCHIITYDEEICPLMKVENAEEDCHFPVLPFGFCNSICGAYILLKGGNLGEIRRELDEFTSENGVIGHVSKTNGYIQIVLVEKGDYTGNIEHLASQFKEKISSKKLFKTYVKLETSKQAVVKNPVQKAIGYIFFYLFIAVAILCTVILYYQDYCVNVPFPSFGSTAELGAFRFARFQNESGSGDEDGEILEVCPPDPAREERRQSFYNPIYSQDKEGPDDSFTLSTLTQLEADVADSTPSNN
ncbi:protein amnionless [Cimex lectularius]|uniref:Protein amnionless n=1 Tax=Cimex lectularius TaxID=79782 RepID=A0A8I6S661_CIMLE|nr:protein amnionless [Cimex lectularius]